MKNKKPPQKIQKMWVNIYTDVPDEEFEDEEETWGMAHLTKRLAIEGCDGFGYNLVEKAVEFRRTGRKKRKR